MRTLSGFDFKGKVVLLRADLNSDVHEGEIGLSERIKESVKTISELKRKGAKVAIVAHQGRRGKDDFIGLKQHAKFLNKYVKVKFVNDVCGKRAVKIIEELKNGEIVLLDNVRFVRDEFRPEKRKKNKLFKLVEIADVFVNDAFSVCHREQASLVLFPRYLKSFAGRLLEKEVVALQKIKIKNCLYVLGGAKPKDNIKLLNGRKVLACGLFGQMCLIAKGKDLGAQNKYLKKNVKDYFKIVGDLKKRLRNVKVPVDFAIKVNGKRKELSVEDFPSRYEIFDIGKETQKEYIEEIKKAEVVFMKGPAGYSADKNFAKGTIALLRTIAASKNFSLVGGGHLSDTIKKYKLSGFSHVSLSGGALLRCVAGEKLIGLEALNKKIKGTKN